MTVMNSSIISSIFSLRSSAVSVLGELGLLYQISIIILSLLYLSDLFLYISDGIGHGNGHLSALKTQKFFLQIFVVLVKLTVGTWRKKVMFVFIRLSTSL